MLLVCLLLVFYSFSHRQSFALSLLPMPPAQRLASSTSSRRLPPPAKESRLPPNSKRNLPPRQQEIESLTKRVDDLQQRLNTDVTPSDADRSRLSVQGTRLSQRLDRQTNDYQEDVNAQRSEILNRIGGKMMNVINRYAQEGNYVAIFDSSAQNSSLLFAAKNIDITQDILRQRFRRNLL
jgi:Skp family chaperone for outer membrane proteins